MRLSAPTAMTNEHQTARFDCGVTSLNAWLQHRALAIHQNGASRVFVVADENQQIQGYYALAAGEISHEQVTGTIRRNMPDPIPVVILARLAVNRLAQGKEIGRGLLRDAFLRANSAAEHIALGQCLCMP